MKAPKLEGYDGTFPANPRISQIIDISTSEVALKDIAMQAFSQATIYGYNTTDLQSDISVSGDKVIGELKYLSDGQLVDAFGAGNFIALEYIEKPEGVTSIKIGMYPTFKNGVFVYDDSGLGEVASDPDKGGAFKVTNKDLQYFKIVSSDGTKVHSQLFKLNSLVCEEASESEG